MDKKDIERLKNTGYRKREQMSRKDYNKQILNKIQALVEQYPDQRFGQIIANYIFPNYRTEDIFFEESEETAKRKTTE